VAEAVGVITPTGSAGTVGIRKDAPPQRVEPAVLAPPFRWLPRTRKCVGVLR